MLYLRLQHIAPHAQHLQPVRMIQIVLEIELVEPQRRDEGGPVRGGVGRAEEGECEIWSKGWGGVSWGGRGGRREERGGREEWGGREGGREGEGEDGQEDLLLAVGWAEGIWWEGTEFED